MALPMLYSRRKRLANQGTDVYQYEVMTPKLRQQILFVVEEWESTIRGYNDYHPILSDLVALMRKELGVACLTNWSNSEGQEFTKWFLTHEETDYLLDAIEAAVLLAQYHAGRRHDGFGQAVEAGVAEINARALESGFGFQIEGNQIIEIANTFAHKEITIPALHLLDERDFQEANKEFRQAFEEYKSGNYDDCIHDCCNAFESVLKVILAGKGWAFNQNDPAKRLLSAAFENELIPAYMQNEFSGLRTILESGVPTVRNKEGGHGTGANPRNIPKHIAAFQLHQTAAAIILLVEAAK